MTPSEFNLIERIRSRVSARGDVVLGIGDDAAVLQVPANRQLVVAMDTLNAGVHFPEATAAADIGWKALAVNLSDLAAMGAEPAWCTLSLSLPDSDADWLDQFIGGFQQLAMQHGVALVGGDTTRGPLSVCVTVHGFVEPARVLRRDGARVGDDIWVSGSLGDAAAALAVILDDTPRPSGFASLRERLDRPTPRVALGLGIAPLVHSAIDISDGLLADLDHICAASGCGARIMLETLPASTALREAVDAQVMPRLQASGGDDYELCFTAPVDARAAIEQQAMDCATPVTRIGMMVQGERVRVLDGAGNEWMPPRSGYVHFSN